MSSSKTSVSLAVELCQVCMRDWMAKVMTDIPVRDTLDIYFPAISDLAHQYRVWYGPVFQKYLAIYKIVPVLLLVAP